MENVERYPADADSHEAPVGAAEPVPVRSAAQATVTKRRRAPRTRRVVAWALIVLASLLIPISVISAWAIRTVTDTDQYVSTMAPLARNDVIVNHLADKATDELFSSHAVENKVAGLLPSKAKPIVPTIRNQLENYVHGLALQFFQSPKFGQLWDGLNRRTHEAVVNVLEGKHGRVVSSVERNGQVVVNVTQALTEIIDKADARGVTVFDSLKPRLENGHKLGVTIVSKQQVSKYTKAFNTLVTLRWAVPVVALVLGVLAIVIAVERRKTLLRLTIGIALFTVVLLVVLDLGRNAFLNQAAKQSIDPNASGAVWDTLLRFLKTDFRWMLLVSVLVALAAWVAGPGRYAVRIRSTFAKGGRWVAAQARVLTGSAGRAAAGSPRARRTGGWILEHLKGLRILGVVVASLVVLLGGTLTGWSVVVLVVVLAAYLGLLQLTAIWARRTAAPAAPAAVSKPT